MDERHSLVLIESNFAPIRKDIDMPMIYRDFSVVENHIILF